MKQNEIQFFFCPHQSVITSMARPPHTQSHTKFNISSKKKVQSFQFQSTFATLVKNHHSHPFSPLRLLTLEGIRKVPIPWSERKWLFISSFFPNFPSKTQMGRPKKDPSLSPNCQCCQPSVLNTHTHTQVGWVGFRPGWSLTCKSSTFSGPYANRFSSSWNRLFRLPGLGWPPEKIENKSYILKRIIDWKMVT